MEQQNGFSRVLILLKQWIEAYKIEHPQTDFPLLCHKEETLMKRMKALFYAPLLGIDRLTEFDVKEHCLDTLIGRNYQSSTLNQFLGQLERINAGEALIPALLPSNPGNIAYIDGHMIAYWSRVSMHKGKITMLGRIMSGSQAVITHNQEGQALFVEYHPPDIHMTSIILDYCAKIVSAAGIELFVIDREVNSVEIARTFAAKGWGLLSMLNKNEHDGLSSWNTTLIAELEDGSKIHSAQWKEERKDDPREFVIVEKPDEHLLPYWSTPKVKEILKALQWPEVYNQRNEIQENAFRQMKEHLSLDVNYGRKKITGPDRHQKRRRNELEKSLAASQKKIEKKQTLLNEQQKKVRESEEKGHGKRLEQRQQGLVKVENELKEVKDKEDKINKKIEDIGPPRTRSDRDFQKQTIMTFRSLFMMNAIKLFIMTLSEQMKEEVSLELIMSLFFERTGAYLENCSKIIYWCNTTGLSSAYKKTLGKIVEGVTAMNLQCRGKPIRVRLREGVS
jgi:hypothetical protein